MDRTYPSRHIIYPFTKSTNRANVTSNTNRIPGGNATRWHTREEALNAFYSALDDGLVERVSHTVVRTVLDRNDHFEIPSS